LLLFLLLLLLLLFWLSFWLLSFPNFLTLWADFCSAAGAADMLDSLKAAYTSSTKKTLARQKVVSRRETSFHFWMHPIAHTEVIAFNSHGSKSALLPISLFVLVNVGYSFPHVCPATILTIVAFFSLFRRLQHLSVLSTQTPAHSRSTQDLVVSSSRPQ
jgi:hypothetical protein